MINSLIVSPIKCVILSLTQITVVVLSINTDNMKTCSHIVSTTIYEEAQVTRTQKQVKRKPSENQLKQKSNVLIVIQH